MPVVPLSPREFQEKVALCWSCANATGADCPYFSIKEPHTGLEVVGAVAYMTEVEGRPSFKVVECPPSGQFVHSKIACRPSFKVVECPHFREGPLRPLDEQALLAIAFL
jgi:hypothetical protein